MTNNEIIKRIYKLHLMLKSKNDPIATALGKITIPLIEYNKTLAKVSREELLEIEGIGEVTVDLILRVTRGEHVYDIAKDIPKYKRKEKWELECLKSGASSRI